MKKKDMANHTSTIWRTKIVANDMGYVDAILKS